MAVSQEEANNPEWEKATRVHDWRNHVSKEVKVIWHTFTDVQRFVLANAADEEASDEHWE